MTRLKHMAVPLLLVGCAPESAPIDTSPEPPGAGRPMATMQQSPEPEPDPVVAVTVTDPYTGAEDWCYEVDDLPPCRREDDPDANVELPTTCTPDPHTGRQRICVDPWWVAGHERVCVPKPLGKRERDRARSELVSIVYRRANGRHEGLCRPQSWWRWGQGHAADENKCNPERLSLLLRLVSWREARHDARKTHLLNPDKAAAAGAWKRKRDLYASNEHYWQSYRWRSRGPYGQNPALHLFRWDRTAPPEALCNRVIATETYLETARSCHRRLASLRGHDPDWWDVHHCASGGKFDRPEVIPTDRGSFHDRALDVGLDPYERVPYSWLGEPIDHDMQTVRSIEDKVASYVEAHR